MIAHSPRSRACCLAIGGARQVSDRLESDQRSQVEGASWMAGSGSRVDRGGEPTGVLAAATLHCRWLPDANRALDTAWTGREKAGGSARRGHEGELWSKRRLADQKAKLLRSLLRERPLRQATLGL